MFSHKINPLLKSLSSCLIMIQLLETCIGKKTSPHCPPSSCGNIPNISHPFRLKKDPKHCGNPDYELACEDNTTYVHFDSDKYIVRSINYPNRTIRLSHASILENDSCSFPTHHLSPYDLINITSGRYSITRRGKFSVSRVRYFHRQYPYGFNESVIKNLIAMTCPYQVNNSLLLEVASNCGHTDYYGRNESDTKHHMYMRSGHFNGSWITDNCTIDLTGMTSKLPVLAQGEKSVPLSEIHSSLLYGLELSWFNSPCGGKCADCFVDGKQATCRKEMCFVGSHWEIPCVITGVLFVIDGAEDWKVYFYVSPYKRSLDTLRNLAKAFDRSRIAGVREEPRLREQDFGNFQDQEQMKIQKAARKLYGRFFYRFPNGESAADVYDRITGFRETLRSDIDIGRFQPPGEQSPNMNLVIVSHGLTLRVFLMRWYKWTVEQFEGLHNIDNGKMVVMERGYGGRYSLLMHHTREELKEFGLTDAMLIDQEWQKCARPGELNYDCEITGPSYFTHFDGDQ
ncbi:Phosphoglycerate mutase-like protein AT74 [Striga hermonthica]|uniref:Phosphoglycerate mutase-like protein AT74 n=1 Tax=Striga hermonthica TaxID=68872 RepID=A0A9N7NU09_STRHE|nr:Phosphoglycerate mutase-like protein AT74 [Striga hermonthica]